MSERPQSMNYSNFQNQSNESQSQLSPQFGGSGITIYLHTGQPGCVCESCQSLYCWDECLVSQHELELAMLDSDDDVGLITVQLKYANIGEAAQDPVLHMSPPPPSASGYGPGPDGTYDYYTFGM